MYLSKGNLVLESWVFFYIKFYYKFYIKLFIGEKELKKKKNYNVWRKKLDQLGLIIVEIS